MYGHTTYCINYISLFLVKFFFYKLRPTHFLNLV